MSRGCRGASCHLTVRTSGQSDGSDGIVDKIKTVMKKRFQLDQVSSVALNDGPLIILSAPASGQNPSLTGTIQVFKSQEYVSINLEGCGSLNTPAVDSSFDFISGADSLGINNNSMDNLKSLLNQELGFEAEKIPVLRRLFRCSGLFFLLRWSNVWVWFRFNGLWPNITLPTSLYLPFTNPWKCIVLRWSSKSGRRWYCLYSWPYEVWCEFVQGQRDLDSWWWWWRST